MPDDLAPRVGLLSDAFRMYRAELRAFIQAQASDIEADDVLQLAMLRATEHVAELGEPEKLRAWLFRIARNTLIDTLRAKRSRERLVASEGDPPDIEGPSADESCRCSVQLSQALPASEATILALVDLRDASLAEAAAALNITVNNATVRLHRARKALRERLREHCGVASSRECKDCRCVYDGCCDA